MKAPARLGLAALALLADGSVPLVAKSMKAARSTPAATHCAADETPIYSCRFGKKVGSVCGKPGRVSYRYGAPGKPEIDIANDAGWTNVRYGSVTGGGGGKQSRLRFHNGEWDYVVFWGHQGSLHVEPGKPWSGINVQHIGKEAGRDLECPGGKALASADPEGDFYRFVPPELKGKLDEDDPSFDVWF